MQDVDQGKAPAEVQVQVLVLAQELDEAPAPDAELDLEGILDLEPERALEAAQVVEVVCVKVQDEQAREDVVVDVVVGEMGRNEEAPAVGTTEQDEEEEVVVLASNIHKEDL